jgi:hypothetical protein
MPSTTRLTTTVRAVTEAEDEEGTTPMDGMVLVHLNETIGGHRDYLEEDFEGADELDNEA